MIIGPTLALGAYQFVTLGVEAWVSPQWSFSLSAGGIGNYNLLHDPTISRQANGVASGGNIDNIDASFLHMEGKGMWFPWGETFFVGLSGGVREIVAKSDVTITSLIPNSTMEIASPITVDFRVRGAFLSPSFGWRGLWDSGFLLATEIGAQLFFYGQVDQFSVDTSQINPALLYTVTQSASYQSAVAILQDDIAPYFKNRPLFYWDIVRIGFLF